MLVTAKPMKKRRKPEIRRLHVLDCSDPDTLEAFFATLPMRSPEEFVDDLRNRPQPSDEEFEELKDAIYKARAQRREIALCT